MDPWFERNYRAALEERFEAALAAWRAGDVSALQRLEDVVAAMQAVRFGIPKSSITRLWSLNTQAVMRGGA
jgi:hypothetical protein